MFLSQACLTEANAGGLFFEHGDEQAVHLNGVVRSKVDWVDEGGPF